MALFHEYELCCFCQPNHPRFAKIPARPSPRPGPVPLRHCLQNSFRGNNISCQTPCFENPPYLPCPGPDPTSSLFILPVDVKFDISLQPRHPLVSPFTDYAQYPALQPQFSLAACASRQSNSPRFYAFSAFFCGQMVSLRQRYGSLSSRISRWPIPLRIPPRPPRLRVLVPLALLKRPLKPKHLPLIYGEVL